MESGDYIRGDMETDARQNNDHKSHSQEANKLANLALEKGTVKVNNF